MQVVGIFLLIASIWTIWAGVESLNPLFLALAILQNSSSAQDIVAQAKQQVTATNASQSVGIGDLIGAALQISPSQLPGSNSGGNVPQPGVLQSQQTGQGPQNAYQNYAREQLQSKYGITDPGQFNSLVKLWNQESGWNPTALNKSSGAFGIPQALPANKIPGAQQATAQQQIDWGLQYIIQRYGSPNNAWAHEVANNWY